MSAHYCARAGAVNVNIAGFDLRFCALDVRWAAGKKPGSERIISAVGNCNRFVEITHFYDTDHRPENFLARDAHIWFHIRKNSWRNKEAFGRHILTLISQRGLRLTDLGVLQNSIVCGFVNYWADSNPRFFRVANPDAGGGFEQTLHDTIIIFLEQNQTG